MNPFTMPLTSLPRLFIHPYVNRKWIDLYRNRQLHRLVTHAYNNVPYYRRLFSKAGVKPDDIRTVEDLTALPITSKKDIPQLAPKEIVSRGVNPGNLIVRKTSGSSGESMIIRRTWFEERLLQALNYRAMYSFGLRMRDRRASMVLVREIHPNDNQILLRIANMFGLNRRLLLDPRQPIENMLKVLMEFRPDILGGYPGVLSQVAERSVELNCRGIRPRLILTGGEVLTPHMRKQISESFSAPVFNMYSSHEYNLIAWECMQTGDFHINDDGLIVEVIQNGKPVKEGERGEIVGTNLHSFAMPFIRYRLGDIVTKGSSACRCGKPYATIRSIQGRMLDYFLLPGGRMLHPYEITTRIRNIAVRWIRQYQLLQERKDRIIMRVIPFDNFPSRKLTEIENKISLIVGKDVEFRIILVSTIESEETAKFRVSRSLVKSEYDNIDWHHLSHMQTKNSTKKEY